MSNYAATVVKIDNLRKHNNADRLLCTTIFQNNVIVGLGTKEGDIGIFFPLESCIGEEFAAANDLIRRKDENGKNSGGMFDSNRRVRAQTFRGEKSMGFFIPIDSLNKTFAYLNKETPQVQLGQEFEELEGVSISKKYVIPTNYFSNSNSKQGKQPRVSRLIDGQFHFHFDTAQLAKNLHKVQPNDLIAVLWKFHGTSGIVANVLVKKNLKWYEKTLKKLGIDIVDTEYDHIYSSRRVVKNSTMKEHNHFYNFDIWTDAGKKFEGKLHKGEAIYYELVGFAPNGNCIQKGFDYGCKPNCYDIYIYRITQTNPDGVVVELPWHQVKHRAVELGFKFVPEIFYGNAEEFVMPMGEERFEKQLYDLLASNYVHDQDSQFCKNKVPEEGIVVRVERGDGIENLKLKAYRFFEHETKQLDKGEVDMEEAA